MPFVVDENDDGSIAVSKSPALTAQFQRTPLHGPARDVELPPSPDNNLLQSMRDIMYDMLGPI